MKTSHLFAPVALFCLGFSGLHAANTPPAPAGKELAKAHPFDLNQVRLLEGPFQHAQELERKFLLAMNPDMLLYPFRREAKLPSPVKGSDALGWQTTGHALGHYLSGCALMYRNTGDQELKARADGIIKALAECQAAIGSGYLGGLPERSILVLQNRLKDPTARAAVPWYCLHKVYAGLLDMHTLAGNAQALEVVERIADWIESNTNALSQEEMQRMLDIEYGGMNEFLANLYAVTGKEKHLKLSMRFNHARVTEPFLKGEDPLDGIHANTTIPKFTGLARQYLITGDPNLAKMAEAFWTTVVNERSYVTGGNSSWEHFSPKANLSAFVHIRTTESCNSYNMLKLTRGLFLIDPKAGYADYYERTLINHILSSQHPETGGQIYFQPLVNGEGKRGWGIPDSKDGGYSCCQGTSLESNSKYADSIYFQDGGETLFINLFIASTLDWKERGVTLRQETNYPDEGSSRFSFECKKPTQLTVNVRRPWWATNGFEVQLNGKPHPVESAPGSYVAIKRVWNNGDTLSVTMPFSMRMEGFKDDPKRAAIMAGPLVLAAITEPENPFSAIVSETPEKAAETLQPVAGKPMEFTGSPAIFRTDLLQTGTASVEFKPLYRMVNERYIVYWDQFQPQEFAKLPAVLDPEINRQKELDPHTVDLLFFGVRDSELSKPAKGTGYFIQEILLRGGKLSRPIKAVSEEAHNAKFEKLEVGMAFTRQSRYPGDLPHRLRKFNGEGSVSFQVRVEPGQAQELRLRLWCPSLNDHGVSVRGGKLDLEVSLNGQLLTTGDLRNLPFDQFADLSFPIPADLPKEKTATVLVRTKLGFAGFYEARIVKK